MESSVSRKTKEEIGRFKISKLLWAMDFQDDDPAATARIMRKRLRRIEEKTKKRSKIKKITFKCGGKRFVKKSSGNNEDGGAMELNSDDGATEIKDFIRSIGGSEAELVIQKRLTISDCDKNQGRLLIPVLQVKNNGFLTVDEKTQLGMRESISVEVFDPQRRNLTLNLGQWKMKNENYVLKTNWTKLVQTNGFKENMDIQVLSFRVHRKLCFAVVRV